MGWLQNGPPQVVDGYSDTPPLQRGLRETPFGTAGTSQVILSCYLS
jgi:hypothetical protein